MHRRSRSQKSWTLSSTRFLSMYLEVDCCCYVHYGNVAASADVVSAVVAVYVAAALLYWSCWVHLGLLSFRCCYLSLISWPMLVFMYGLCSAWEEEIAQLENQCHSSLTSSWQTWTSPPFLSERVCSTVIFTLQPSQWCCMSIEVPGWRGGG